jgi:ParB family chromosome partitioning protein
MASIRKKLADKKSKLSTSQERLGDHPASLNRFQEGNFYNVEITFIKPDPDQPRKFFDQKSLDELAQSIKQKGVLQPVIIRRDENGAIHLVAGERRLRAAKKAGLNKIPAIFTGGNPREISLIENLQRDNLKPLEEAEALSKMIDEHNYTHEQLALAIGKARSTITETLSLNKLPEEIKKECRRADIYPRRLLVEVAKKKTPGEMVTLFEKIKKSGWKSEEARDQVRKRPQTDSRSQEEIALQKIADLIRCLKKVDFSNIEEQRRLALAEELENLKRLIEEIFTK